MPVIAHHQRACADRYPDIDVCPVGRPLPRPGTRFPSACPPCCRRTPRAPDWRSLLKLSRLGHRTCTPSVHFDDAARNSAVESPRVTLTVVPVPQLPTANRNPRTSSQTSRQMGAPPRVNFIQGWYYTRPSVRLRCSRSSLAKSFADLSVMRLENQPWWYTIIGGGLTVLVHLGFTDAGCCKPGRSTGLPLCMSMHVG